MRGGTFLWFSVGVCVGCSGGTSVASPGDLEVSALVRSRVASAGDTVGPFFVYPFAMAPWKDSLAVVDMLGSRVVVLPWSLEGGREFGASGEGPGEIRRPQGVAAVGDTLVVFDRGNARLSWFGPDSGFLYGRQVMILGIRPTFAPRPGGVVLLPTGMASHYALLDSNGGQLPYLPRPAEGRPPAEAPITSNLIVSTAEGGAVADAENGLVAFATPEGVPLVFSLPPQLRSEVDLQLDSLRAGDPAGEMVLTPFIAAGEAPDGVLVWFPGQGRLVGAVVNREGKWRAIRVRDPSVELPPNPFDVLLREGELYLLTAEGVRVFDVNG